MQPQSVFSLSVSFIHVNFTNNLPANRFNWNVLSCHLVTICTLLSTRITCACLTANLPNKCIKGLYLKLVSTYLLCLASYNMIKVLHNKTLIWKVPKSLHIGVTVSMVYSAYLVKRSVTLNVFLLNFVKDWAIVSLNKVPKSHNLQSSYWPNQNKTWPFYK